MVLRVFLLALIASTIGFDPAEAGTICTIVTDAKSNRIIIEQGDCTTRVTPASTFKVALGVMGYDAGFLKDELTPALPFKKGYLDYGGEAWKQTTGPVRWLKYSVVWYSQQITRALGEKALHDYALKFSYVECTPFSRTGSGLRLRTFGPLPELSWREEAQA